MTTKTVSPELRSKFLTNTDETGRFIVTSERTMLNQSTMAIEQSGVRLTQLTLARTAN